MRLRPEIEFADAEAGAQAARAEASLHGWAITVAIVDAGGTAVLLTRMDDCTPLAVDTALGKARSAAMTGLDTSVIEEMLGKRPALATLGRVSVEGGVPILFDGHKVGGVGVSGVRSDQDSQVARAALLALLNHAQAKGKPAASVTNDTPALSGSDILLNDK